MGFSELNLPHAHVPQSMQEPTSMLTGNTHSAQPRAANKGGTNTQLPEQKRALGGPQPLNPADSITPQKNLTTSKLRPEIKAALIPILLRSQLSLHMHLPYNHHRAHLPHSATSSRTCTFAPDRVQDARFPTRGQNNSAMSRCRGHRRNTD